MTIGERIRARRKELHMTQDELALKIGYSSKTAISKIELDDRNLKQDKIKPIAQALDTTVSYIMGWDEEEEKGFAEGTVIGKALKDPDQIHLLEDYQQLDADNRGKLLQFADALTLLP